MALLSSLDVLAGFTCVAVPVPHMANAETAELLLARCTRCSPAYNLASIDQPLYRCASPRLAR